MEGHRQKTLERAKEEELVLMIQDTSDFNFTHHPSKTWKKGFGQTCSQNYVRGLKVHSSLMVSTQGVPLGICDLQIWTREPKKNQKQQQKLSKSLKEKESKRWLRGLVDAELAVSPKTKVVTITDREGDIYEMFAMERSDNSELLIRAKHNRRVESELKYLFPSLRASESQGEIEIVLPKTEKRMARKAIATISYTQVKIISPQNCVSKQESISVNVLSVVEENPPKGEKGIEWILLTTLPIANYEDVLTYIRWYTYRWLIERYHYVLKSGCGVEKLQLETAERIKKALATYAIVASRLLWLLYESRNNPDMTSELVFSQDEWQSLYCYIHKTSSPPNVAPSIKQVIIWIAKLGGFLGRKKDGEPGIKCLWKGLRRLFDIAQSWMLAKSPSNKDFKT
ncbi:IS4 family transposase [Geminocystis sp. CENA526]|uniref:IS4 family transposase n=1 Tax=Geminocystis sp. CENA526 TaxID=1355871 RepID=UPI003D6DEAD0